jgi:uncharacterized protein
MATITVRKFARNLKTPIGRYWNGGSVARTAVFNALNMCLPIIERMSIESLMRAARVLTDERDAALRKEIDALVDQEAHHLIAHSVINTQLADHGLRNKWGGRMAKRSLGMSRRSLLFAVGVTVCVKHLTVVFSRWIFETPEVLKGAEPQMHDLWHWHASEELEHRAVAFSVHNALGGTRAYRNILMCVVTAYFIVDLTRQVADNLRQERAIGRTQVWGALLELSFAKRGLFRFGFALWRSFFHKNFHPQSLVDDWSRRWFFEHHDRYEVVAPVSSEG